MHTFLRKGRGVDPRRQSGAALYVALIMLILLALLGIAGMQVAGMQERMSSNYRAFNAAFQNTETVVRNAERSIESVANRTALPAGSLVNEGSISSLCTNAFDPVAWGGAQTLAAVPAVTVRQIDQCIEGEGDISMGKPADTATPIYQITAFAADDTGNATSSAVIDTVFKL